MRCLVSTVPKWKRSRRGGRRCDSHCERIYTGELGGQGGEEEESAAKIAQWQKRAEAFSAVVLPVAKAAAAETLTANTPRPSTPLLLSKGSGGGGAGGQRAAVGGEGAAGVGSSVLGGGGGTSPSSRSSRRASLFTLQSFVAVASPSYAPLDGPGVGRSISLPTPMPSHDE